MVYTSLAGIIVLLALVVVAGAGRLLLKGSWVMGWIRGMVGLALLLMATTLVFAALDLYSYKQLGKEQSIATLSFNRKGAELYQVSLVDSSGVEQIYELNGDLWQLDARIIKWNRSLAGLGLTPGYRLDRLSGRYFSLEKEQNEKHSVYQLGQSQSVLDIWSWLREYGRSLSVIDATYGSATYLPMEDGALFSVSLTGTGLIARPLNDRAKAAVDRWQ